MTNNIYTTILNYMFPSRISFKLGLYILSEAFYLAVLWCLNLFKLCVLTWMHCFITHNFSNKNLRDLFCYVLSFSKRDYLIFAAANLVLILLSCVLLQFFFGNNVALLFSSNVFVLYLSFFSLCVFFFVYVYINHIDKEFLSKYPLLYYALSLVCLIGTFFCFYHIYLSILNLTSIVKFVLTSLENYLSDTLNMGNGTPGGISSSDGQSSNGQQSGGGPSNNPNPNIYPDSNNGEKKEGSETKSQIRNRQRKEAKNRKKLQEEEEQRLNQINKEHDEFYNMIKRELGKMSEKQGQSSQEQASSKEEHQWFGDAKDPKSAPESYRITPENKDFLERIILQMESERSEKQGQSSSKEKEQAQSSSKQPERDLTNPADKEEALMSLFTWKERQSDEVKQKIQREVDRVRTPLQRDVARFIFNNTTDEGIVNASKEHKDRILREVDKIIESHGKNPDDVKYKRRATGALEINEEKTD